MEITSYDTAYIRHDYDQLWNAAAIEIVWYRRNALNLELLPLASIKIA